MVYTFYIGSTFNLDEYKSFLCNEMNKIDEKNRISAYEDELVIVCDFFDISLSIESNGIKYTSGERRMRDKPFYFRMEINRF